MLQNYALKVQEKNIMEQNIVKKKTLLTKKMCKTI